jgi:hypothetical protein
MPGHLTKALVTQWATDAYIGGFQAAMDASGTGIVPTDIDVSIFDPRNNGETSKSTKRNKVNAEERGQLDYDPCKCDARVWNSGFGAQCNRKKVDDEMLCVTCLNKNEALESKGLQLAFGLVTGERPLVSLDKEVGDDLVWKDMKKETSSAPKKRAQKMPPVGEMREYLDARGTSHDGCKKPEVFELYQEQKELEALESSQETLESSNDSSSNEVVENPLNVDPLDVSTDINEDETQDDEKPKKKKKSKKKKGKKKKKKQDTLEISEEDAKAKIALAKAAAEKAAAEKAAAEEAAAEALLAEEAESEGDSGSGAEDSGEETDDMSDNEDNSDDSDEDLDEDETETISYQGVDYFHEVSSNKILDPKGTHVGSWSAGRRSIAWNTDADLEAHQKLVE